MTIGESMKKHRKQQGLTYEKLSEKILRHTNKNISISTLYRYENNFNVPNFKTIETIAKVLGNQFVIEALEG